jgi:antitoxin component YwqK of YwqJK toxin-antitoxin module
VKRLFIIFLTAFLLAMVCNASAFAADIDFTIYCDTTPVSPDGSHSVTIGIDTKGLTVGGTDITVTFDPAHLTLTGSSVIGIGQGENNTVADRLDSGQYRIGIMYQNALTGTGDILKIDFDVSPALTPPLTTEVAISPDAFACDSYGSEFSVGLAAGSCTITIGSTSSTNEPPTANAGNAQSVTEGVTVTLDGSSSTDSDDGIHTFQWSQVSGSPVTLSDTSAVKPTFTAPAGMETCKACIFQLTVTDHGGLQDTDDVVITVCPEAAALFYPDGDVAPLGNRDGIVNVGDALVALRFALGLETPSQDDIKNGDVAPLDSSGNPNPDGAITVGDALVILRKALGLVSWTISSYPGTLFGDVDEDSLLNKIPSSTIETIAPDAEIDVTPTTTKPKLEVTSNEVVNEAGDGSSITITDNGTIPLDTMNQPLFVDGVFKGMVSNIEKSGLNLVMSLQDAEFVTDVYDAFDVEFRNEQIKQSIQRAISHKKLGRYDHLNKEPLGVSIIEKSITNSRGLDNDELVLRIDIPQGYRVPLQSRSLDCSFWNAECNFTLQTAYNNKVDIEKEYGEDGLTFSTKGSYIEIGIGSYIKAHYDHNTFSSDVYDFEVAQSAYFDANLKAEVKGELKKDWSTVLDLLVDFDVEILHPYSHLVKASVLIDPGIVLGVEGKLTGTATVTARVKRSGEIRFKYDSVSNTHEIFNTIKHTPETLTESNINVSIEAEGHAYIFPSTLLIPNLKFLRVSKALTFIYVRSGIKLDNEIKGKIAGGFVALNDQLTDTYYTEASVTTSLYGLIQGRWMVRIGGIDLYHTDEYEDLFQTGALNILEWKAQLLDTPVISVERNDQTSIYKITFDLDFDIKLKPKLHFYYTIDGQDLPVTALEDVGSDWQIGNTPIELNDLQKLKVRAVLYNKDVSDSIWAFGTSVSPQAEYANILPPKTSPKSLTVFEDGTTIDITLTQSQGYDIIYSIDGGAEKKYAGPITLSGSADIEAYAKALIDDTWETSPKVSFRYTRCPEGEIVQDGECVESPGNGNGSQTEESWPGWPELQWCPLTGSNHNINFPDGNPDFVTCSYHGNTDGPILEEMPYYKGSSEIWGYRSKNGVEKQYYESGQLNIERPWKDNKLNGKEKWYYENGQVQFETPWQDGKLNGVKKEYHIGESGYHLIHETPYIDGKKNGLEKLYVYSGELQSETPWQDDKINGIKRTYYYLSGKVESETPYEEGKINGTFTVYYENGQLWAETLYVDDKRNGLYESYYENGQLRYQTPYVDDMKNGTEREYYESGPVKYETPYLGNEKNGIEKRYYESGQVNSETTYVDGKKNGQAVWYYEDGKLANCKIYENDNYVASCMP